MKLARGLAIWVLVFSLLVSNTIITFADSNAGGQNQTTATGKGSVDTRTEYQGYRFTFVETATGHKVGNTIDIYMTPPQGVQPLYYFTGSIAEEWDKITMNDFYPYNYADLKPYIDKWVQSPLNMPWWYSKVGATYGGESISFKNWLLSNQAIENMKLGTSIGKAQELSEEIKNNSGAANTSDVETFIQMCEISIDNFERDYIDRDDYQKIEMYAAYDTINNMMGSTAFKFYMENNVEYSSRLGELQGKLNGLWRKIGIDMTKDIYEPYGLDPGSVQPAVHSVIELMKDKADNEKLEMNDIKKKKEVSWSDIENIFLMTSYAAPAGSGAGGAGGATRVIQVGQAIDDILGKDAEGNGDININADAFGYLTALMAVGSDEELKNPSIFSKEEPAKAFMERFFRNEISLIVEPVIWFSPQRNGVRFPNGRILGTTRNWTRFAAVTKFANSGIFSDVGMGTRSASNMCLMDNVALEMDENTSAALSGFERDPVIDAVTGLPYVRGVGQKSTNWIPWTTAWAYINSGIGIGMHIYAVKLGDSWDDGPPDGTPYGLKPPNRKPQGKPFTVVKMYQYLGYKDGGLVTIPFSYHRMDNVPRTVRIVDESANGWELIEWYTTPTEAKIENGKDPKEYEWEKVKKENTTGTYSGTEIGTVTVQEDDPDNVLYILLEQRPTKKPGQVTVIKVYDDEDGVTEKVTTETTEDKPYPVPIDDDYEYVETKITPNTPKDTHTWEDSEGDSLGIPPLVEYPEETQTIYIHYVKKPKDPTTKPIILWENELSYNYDLRDLLLDRKLIGIYDIVDYPNYSWNDCPGHGSRDNRWYHRGKSQRLVKNWWVVAVQDNFDENTLPFIKDWKYITDMQIRGVTGNSGGGGERYKVTPNASFLLIRDKNDDKVTLYPNKNEGVKSELSYLNVTEGYTSTDTRFENKRETTKTEQYERTLHTGLAYSAARDTRLTWITHVGGSHANTGGYDTRTGVGPDNANAAYSKKDNVEIRYFLGEAGKGEETPSDVRSDWNKKFSRNTSYAKTSADLSFYPYLKYLYYYKDNTTPNDVMVTSSNLSGMKVFNAIQAGVYKKNEINANLTSTQWSTHARSLSFLKTNGISDKKSVLPGGAIQDIDMGNKGDTQIGVTLWQACLPDTQVQAVQEGFKVSETEARTAANALIEEIKKSISGYGLVQWGQEGTETDYRTVIEVGEELHESTSVSLVTGNSGRTASDDKYYLRHDGTGSSRANFDVLDSRIENQFVYTIYSDTEGNVWVTKDGTELGRISKTEDASKLLQNTELKLLDDNTKLITNYISCIQRNIGNARDGSTWHNEAFDGVSVLMTDISFDVGFGGDSAKRTNVLDPLLVAKAQSKSDLYNFEDESNIRSSVYVTTKISSQAEKPDQEGYLGTLKAVSGMGDLETGLTDIQSMVYTKNFYIPNATVSDLN